MNAVRNARPRWPARDRTGVPGLFLSLITTALAIGSIEVSAQGWISGGGNVRWSQANNWAGGAVPANDGTANLVFGLPGVSGSGFAPNMDADWDIASIIFADSNPGSYHLRSSGGYTLTIQAGGIVNNSGFEQTISNAVVLGANQIWNAMAGPLSMHGGVANNGHDLTISGSWNTRISGTISGSGGLRKEGSGTLILPEPGTYSGNTIVNAGTLQVNNGTGSATGSGNVTVNSGATLTGRGSISGTVWLGGVLAPGNGVGRLSSGAQTWNPGASLVWEIADAAVGQTSSLDAVFVTGGLTIFATPLNPFVVQVRSLTARGEPGLASNFDPSANYAWPVVTTTGGILGFDPEVVNLDVSGFQNPFTGEFRLSLANNGNDLFLNYSAVPEPSAAMLIGLGAVLLVTAPQFRRNN